VPPAPPRWSARLPGRAARTAVVHRRAALSPEGSPLCRRPRARAVRGNGRGGGGGGAVAGGQGATKERAA